MTTNQPTGLPAWEGYDYDYDDTPAPWVLLGAMVLGAVVWALAIGEVCHLVGGGL